MNICDCFATKKCGSNHICLFTFKEMWTLTRPHYHRFYICTCVNPAHSILQEDRILIAFLSRNPQHDSWHRFQQLYLFFILLVYWARVNIVLQWVLMESFEFVFLSFGFLYLFSDLNELFGDSSFSFSHQKTTYVFLVNFKPFACNHPDGRNPTSCLPICCCFSMGEMSEYKCCVTFSTDRLLITRPF